MSVRTYRILLSKETARHQSRRAAAIKIGIPPASLGNYLDTDTVPIMRVLLKLSSYFNVPVPDLLRDCQDEQFPTSPFVHGSQATSAVATPDREDKYRVIAEVGEILDSGNVDIIDALVKNVREFRRAVDNTKKLNSCLDQINAMQTQINKLTQKVDGLTTPPTGADALAASSGKRGT